MEEEEKYALRGKRESCPDYVHVTLGDDIE